MRKLIFTLLACVALAPLPSHAGSYSEVRIVAPGNDTTIHSNEGIVAVAVTVAPFLASGDQLAIVLDGVVVKKGDMLHFRLSSIDRGSHTLSAQVVAPDGKVLASSSQVVFHVRHASILFRHPEEKK